MGLVDDILDELSAEEAVVDEEAYAEKTAAVLRTLREVRPELERASCGECRRPAELALTVDGPALVCTYRGCGASTLVDHLWLVRCIQRVPLVCPECQAPARNVGNTYRNALKCSDCSTAAPWSSAARWVAETP